jgi:hypothetical protein
MCRHAIEQLPVGGTFCGRLVDHDNVETGQFGLVLPERFPDNALYSVSAGCLPAVLFRNRQAEPGNVCLVLSAKYRKPFVAAARCFFEHAPERRSVQEPVFFLEPVEGAASQEMG